MSAEREDKQKILLTGDTRMSAEEEGRITSDPLIPVTLEQLKHFAELARERKLEFDVIVCAGMTMERALRIRELRTTSSWRTVAAVCFQEWGLDAMWEPPSNQLVGMALCEAAALTLREDPNGFPWQSTA